MIISYIVDKLNNEILEDELQYKGGTPILNEFKIANFTKTLDLAPNALAMAGNLI